MAFLYPLIFLFFLHTCIAEDPSGNFCNKNNQLSSQIATNINHLLAEFSSKTVQNGFIATSYGTGSDLVYGLSQCRGDISTTDCSNCIQDAVNQLKKRCPNHADARIWYDICFLRYDIDNFIGKLDTSYGIFYWNVNNVTDPEVFEKDLGALMDRVTVQALVHENKGLGKDKAKLSPFITLYGLVQCTRDLSQLSCAQCLAMAIENFPKYCQYRKGCRVLYSSCYVRYELYPFFFPLDSKKKIAESYSRFVLSP